MDAVVVDHSEPSGMRRAVADVPRTGPSEALVHVRAFSINSGDLATVRTLPDGAIPGWEAAGVVTEAAADGSGPVAGTPVVTLGESGGWAQYRAVDTTMMGVVPDATDLAEMSTIGVAANSALRALRRIGPILGRTVMITGATGGVGRFAVQLARLGGASVVAVTSAPDQHGDALRALGADSVIASPGEHDGRVRGVVDCVGGRQLVEAFDVLERDGVLVSLGHLDTGPETFSPGAFLSDPSRTNRSIVTFHQIDGTPVPPDLEWLALQVARGTLTTSVAWRGGWEDLDTAISALAERSLRGKAVVEIT